MFLRARMIWVKPHPAPILIYDRTGSDILLEYISSSDAAILEVRGESVNIYLLLRCFLAFDFLARGYIKRYISAVSPSIILTYIDSHLPFYQLKAANPNITTVFVQNAWRGRNRRTTIGNKPPKRAEKRRSRSERGASCRRGRGIHECVPGKDPPTEASLPALPTEGNRDSRRSAWDYSRR